MILYLGVRHNTIHVEDVAVASWAAAEWMSKVGRQEGNRVAGEDIYFCNDKVKIQTVKGAPDPKVKLTAPLFNLVSHVPSTHQGVILTVMLERSMIQTPPLAH